MLQRVVAKSRTCCGAQDDGSGSGISGRIGWKVEPSVRRRRGKTPRTPNAEVAKERLQEKAEPGPAVSLAAVKATHFRVGYRRGPNRADRRDTEASTSGRHRFIRLRVIGN